ncbi:MAG: hypothetical protein ABSE77_12640 [Acidimicrobiales bacterium]|jgi:hypothetical protein
MGTEDELKRCGQAAAALMGVAAARAKQVAEQLLGSRGAKEDAKHRAESLVDEGRKAAADVVSALRKEASVLFRDLEHLEEHLRGAKGSATAPTGTGPAPGDEAVGRTRATTAKAAARKTTGARKSAPAANAPAAKTASVRKSAPVAKAPGAAKGAPTAKTAGRRSAAPEKAAGAGRKTAAAKAPAARKAGGASQDGSTGSGPSNRGRA